MVGFVEGFAYPILKIGHLEDALPLSRNYRPYRKTTAEDGDEEGARPPMEETSLATA